MAGDNDEGNSVQVNGVACAMSATELPAHYAAARNRAHAGARLILGGIALNGLFALLKFIGGFFGHSYALIADGADSLLDVLSSALVWAGFRVAARPPDAEHPFGHGRAEPLAALAVAIFIFFAAGIVALHAVHLIVTPHAGPHWLTLPLLAAIIFTKIWFARRMGRAGDQAGSMALGIEAWHHGTDAITSTAAFVGIAIAVAGGKGWEAADDWAALFACVVVAFNGVAMLQKALGEMMDTAVPADFENKVRAIAAAVPGVSALDKCRVRKSGLSHLVDIQVRVDGDMSVRAGHDIAHRVKDALLTSALQITDVSVHVEPAP
jgi:cation diffusion facilitator family transporter